MTRDDLSQLYYLNREIEGEKRRLRELQDIATGTMMKIAGLPHIGTVSDKAALEQEIDECRRVIEAKSLLCVVEYNRLNRYIGAIDDSLLRQVLSYRFVSGLSWRQVAAHIGGGNTADSVKKICYRFLGRK